jgi:RNA polymerase subunit RPABC4/transcription elongation factor Spt4
VSQQTLGAFADDSRCPTCGRDDFSDERAMRIHHKQVHGDSLADRGDRYRCPVCGRETETKRGLSNHLSKLHPERWERIRREGMVLAPVKVEGDTEL